MAGKLYSAGEEYPDLEEHHNHMAHCLTEELYKKMRSKETTSGFSIDHVIQIGVDDRGNPYELPVGCLAGDEESYEVFAEFFDQVIEAKHGGYKPTDKQPIDYDVTKVEDGELDSDYVIRCRVAGVRNLRGFSLPPHCTRAERRKVEKISVEAMTKLGEGLKGKYHSLRGLGEEAQVEIFGEWKFERPLQSRMLPTCVSRDWPDARGIFVGEKKNFLVKVNEEDHLQVVYFKNGGDLKQSYAGWRNGVEELEKDVKLSGAEFMFNDHLGYVSSCPGNLGTAMRIEVHLKMPKMSKHFRIEEVFRRLRLEKRELDGGEGIFDVSNADRLGLSDVAILQQVIEGVRFVVNCEKKLEKGENIEKEINQLKRK